MVRLIWAVMEDLGGFAYEAIRSLFVVSGHMSSVTTPLLDAPVSRVALSHETETHKARAVASRAETSLSERSPVGIQISSKLHENVLDRGRATLSALKEEGARSAIQKSTVMYTSSYATPLRSAPGAVGDTVYTVLPYGSMVMVLDAEDMWAHVASGPHTGWVYVDDLEDCAADVYPSFHIGEANGADDPSTIRVRAIINDEFGAGDVELPLQAEEYVLYRLYKKGLKIAWPPVRPRLPGMWHTILKDVPNVSVVVKPVGGALMEFMMESEDDEGVSGHIAYVEAVFPDDTIQISETNWPDRGMYNERVLTLEEWQALTPTFLTVG